MKKNKNQDAIQEGNAEQVRNHEEEVETNG